MKYSFSENSLKRLSECKNELITLFSEVIKNSPHDFAITCGYRGAKAQEESFNSGRSKCHFGESAHNSKPSLAIDLCIIKNGKPDWKNIKNYIELAHHVKKIAKELNIKIKSSAIDWENEEDENGEKFVEYVHYQLI